MARKRTGTTTVAKKPTKEDDGRDIPFCRTDERVHFPWESYFAELDAEGRKVAKFEGKSMKAVRAAAVRYTNATGVVLEVGRKDGVPLVKRAASEA